MKSSDFIFVEGFNGDTLMWAMLHGIDNDIVKLEKDLNSIARMLHRDQTPLDVRANIKTNLEKQRDKVKECLGGFLKTDKHLVNIIELLDELIKKLNSKNTIK